MQVLQCTKIEPNKNYHEIKSEKHNQIQLGPCPNPKLTFGSNWTKANTKLTLEPLTTHHQSCAKLRQTLNSYYLSKQVYLILKTHEL